MHFVDDDELLKTIEAMADNLLAGEQKIHVTLRLAAGVIFLGITNIEGTINEILINHKVRRMLKTLRGLARVYAVLAHELGHIMHHRETVRDDFTPADFTEEFRVGAEIGADRHALRMLSKIYPDPLAILTDQIAYAHIRSLKNKYAGLEDVELANLFMQKRSAALNQHQLP